MTVVCTGIEHSGTGLLTRIVRTGIPHAMHRAMPHVDRHGREHWWQPGIFEPARFIIIERDADVWLRSTLRRGGTRGAALARHGMARAALAGIEGYRLTYEALVADPERTVGALGEWLGVTLRVPEPVYDGNALQVRA